MLKPITKGDICFYCNETGKIFDKNKKIFRHPFLNRRNAAIFNRFVLRQIGEDALADKIMLPKEQPMLRSGENVNIAEDNVKSVSKSRKLDGSIIEMEVLPTPEVQFTKRGDVFDSKILSDKQ